MSIIFIFEQCYIIISLSRRRSTNVVAGGSTLPPFLLQSHTEVSFLGSKMHYTSTEFPLLLTREIPEIKYSVNSKQQGTWSCIMEEQQY